MLNRVIHNLFGSKLSFVFGALVQLALFLPAAAWGEIGSPTPSPVKAKNTTLSPADLSMSPQEEIQVLDAIDDGSNTGNAVSKSTTPSTGTPQPTFTPIFSGPPPAPTGVKVLNLKEGVYLSW